MKFDEIVRSVSVWNTIRNTPAGFVLLTSGSVIELTKAQYEKLKASNSPNVHLYIGFDFNTTKRSPVFYLIASEFDVPKTVHQHVELIVSTKFNRSFSFDNPEGAEMINFLKEGSPDTTIQPEIAWQRAFKWMIFNKVWFNKNAEKETVTRAFSIPRKNFDEIFERNEKVLMFLGLVNNLGGADHYTDLILCADSGDTIIQPEVFKNVTMPCPPFNCKDFGLLNL